MPQPVAVDRLAEQLIGQFRTAQTDIEHQLASLGDGRRAARLRELSRSINALITDLEAQTRVWLSSGLPAIYQLGAGDAALAIGDAFVWSQPHLAAMQSLASRSFDDLLSATRYVRRDTKDWIRNEARQQATLSLVEGRTATQAAKALADAAGKELGVFTVTYKDGSRHTMADYADSSIRAISGEAYNQGTITQSLEAGVRFCEVADGTDCGLNGHDDPEKPNGKIYPLDFIASYGLSHPRCRRSLIPRPDLSSAEGAQSLRSAASLADQRQFEQRQTQAAKIAGRSPRTPRTPRAATRTPRTPRAPQRPVARGVSARSAITSMPGARAKVGPGIERGMAAIDKVHRVPEGLRAIPVKTSTANSFYGRYSYQLGANATPSSIAIASHGDHIGSTMTHEYGHYLDHQALGPEPGRWATSFINADHPAMLEWGRAIEDSPTIKALRDLNGSSPSRLSRYYLSAKEIWARSYAQWIAVRAGDTVLLDEIAAIRLDTDAARALSQWDPDEFDTIAATMDRIFGDLGLLA